MIKKQKRIVGKIERREGYLYYVDREGNVWETKLKRGGKKKNG